MLERRSWVLGLFLWMCAVPVLAVVAPAPHPLAVRHPDLYIANVYQPLDRLDPVLALGLRADLQALNVQSGSAFYDVRGGRWGTLLQSRPLIPGSGRGNTLTWGALGLAAPSGEQGLKDAVWTVFTRYLAANGVRLGIDTAQLGPPRIAVHEGGRLVQIHAPRVVGGVPVRDSYLSAVVNHGNLVLLGARNWGTVTTPTQPAVSATAAGSVVRAHAGSGLTGFRGRASLTLVPFENGEDPSRVVAGTGYAYRLAWVLRPEIAGDDASWEALVDAHTGELLSFTDTNQYASAKAVGGVYPVSNDGQVPDGVEHPGFPMPFADVTRPFQPGLFSNGGGLLGGTLGTQARTALSGRYVRIQDKCGPVSEAASCGVIDLGFGPGTDCDVPPGHSPGDTHSARSGFYEVNRIVETARVWLPGNAWLGQQLTANMNINNSCNAFWDGSTINFYRSGGGCGNTGEIAAVFDHEWGHGLDNNDTNPSISAPGEAIADIYALLRLADSCVGRGFLADGSTCDGAGDPCLTCTGVRELDFAKRASGQPHDIDWILSPTDAPGGGCVGIVGIQVGPCGQETHCEGEVPAEAGWDLFNRDLTANHDFNTALEIATRLFYLGAGNVGNWYMCAPGPLRLAGCNADGGYLNLLAADDDNGDLEDGTPHMAALFAAFDRHQIACLIPTVATSGCSGAPAEAPALTVTALENGAQLSWTPVPGAQKYWVFRTEGVKGCDFGKVRIGETTGTTFTDSGLLDGFEVRYSVMPVGAQDTCMGPMSSCVAVVPLAPPPADEAVLAFREVAAPFQILTGDGDDLLDNCERGRFSLEVENVGTLDLNNVRVAAITPVSHPEIEVLTPLPLPLAATLPAPAGCGSAVSAVPVSFTFRARGLAPDETVEFRVEVVSDETVSNPLVGTIRLAVSTEGDFQFVASKTFGFETDLEEWNLVSGTFDRTAGPGGAGTLAYLASSALAPGRCDRIQSPPVRLTPSSTLTLWNQFSIEPESIDFFDRANVGLFEVGSGQRTTVVPDGGRTYNATGTNGVCVTQGHPGWAGAGPGWLPSIWSASALQSASFAGKTVRLDVAYGTDPSAELTGFWFDEVTLTNFQLQVVDVQSDVCPAAEPPVARDDAAETLPGTPVSIDVLANDTTVNPPLAVGSVGQPGHGTAAASGGGVTYSPAVGFSGSDSFTYTACDASGLCDEARVTVEVRCPATATGSFSDSFEPTPRPGWTVQTAVNGLPTSAPWTPVVDPLANSLVISYFSDATTLDLKDDRLIAPPQDLSPSSRLVFWHRFFFEPGFDGGVLEVSRDGGATWVDVLAGGGSFIEGGYNDTIAAEFGNPVAGRSAWSGFSQFIDAMNRVEVDLGAFAGRGVLVRWRLGADQLLVGSLPGAGWWIDDVQFTNLLETPASCALPPRAADDSATTERDAPVTIAVLANDADPNGDALTVGGVTQPAHGTATTDGASVTYTPASGYVGADAFDYSACDPGGLCDTATVSVTVNAVNTPPDARDDAATTERDTAVLINVLANDGDADGDSLSVTSASDPAHGSATVNADGTVTYTPDAGFVGTDSFTYAVSDGQAADTATVTVTVEEPSTGEATRASGNGWLPGTERADFRFNSAKDGSPHKGRISYSQGGFELQGALTALSFPASNRASFEGTCQYGGGLPCRFSASAEDHGEPGAGQDRFEIQVFDAAGNPIHQNGGLLGGGNVKVR